MSVMDTPEPMETVTRLLESILTDLTELAGLTKARPSEIECHVLFAGLLDITHPLPAMLELVAGWINDCWPDAPIDLANDRLRHLVTDLAATSGIIAHIQAR